MPHSSHCATECAKPFRARRAWPATAASLPAARLAPKRPLTHSPLDTSQFITHFPSFESALHSLNCRMPSPRGFLFSLLFVAAFALLPLVRADCTISYTASYGDCTRYTFFSLRPARYGRCKQPNPKTGRFRAHALAWACCRAGRISFQHQGCEFLIRFIRFYESILGLRIIQRRPKPGVTSCRCRGYFLFFFFCRGNGPG